jgi:hypothetical protein
MVGDPYCNWVGEWGRRRGDEGEIGVKSGERIHWGKGDMGDKGG